MQPQEARQQLKKEIIAYLQGVGVSDKEMLTKSLAAIKECAHRSSPIDEEMLTDRKIREYVKAANLENDEFYYRISWHFSARHYSVLVEFIHRLEEIIEAEAEAEAALEAEIEEDIYNQHDPLGDAEYDELGAPDFAVCVYQTHIEVRVYSSGMGEILPKQNRKYVGSKDGIRWQYPLSALPVLERLGRPVVKVAELAR